MDVVLETGELLEAVLLQLDLYTLLLSATRVSRYWHDLITRSPSLQRALFFLPDQQDASHAHRRTQNPFLKKVFPAWFENTRAYTPRPRPGVNPVHIFPATAMMGYRRFQELGLYKTSLRLQHELAARTESGGHDDDDDDDRVVVDNSRRNRRHPFLRPEASWRRMLTSSPACRTICVSNKRGPGASLRRSKGPPVTMHLPDGLRMADLYGLTLHHSAMHPISGFMVIWPDGDELGHLDITRHLRRMSGILPILTEEDCLRVWQGSRPDLYVQLLWTEGRVRPGEVDGNDLGLFWERCGSKCVEDWKQSDDGHSISLPLEESTQYHRF
jgi:hypothetical protein